MTNDQTEIRYPRLIKRIQAALIDSFIFVFFLYGFSSVLIDIEIYGGFKAASFALAIMILEPVLVWKTGGTIGHHSLGLRIQHKQTGRNLSLMLAVVRFLIKLPLGLVSFFFVLLTKRRQAIHDILVNSLVTIKNPGERGHLEGESERVFYNPAFKYPKWYRRIVVMVFYLVASFILFAIILPFFFSEACLLRNVCTPAENMFESIIGVAMLGVFGLVIYLGWSGRLFGARRHSRTE